MFTNHFVSILAAFCFFSLLVEFGVGILGYTIKSSFTFVTFNVCKISISCYFEYINNSLSAKKLFNLAKKNYLK